MLSAAEWKILAALAGCIALIAMAVGALAWLRRHLEGADAAWADAPKHQAHVCAHCGREIIPGSYPPIMSVCPPHVLDCPRPPR